MWESLRNNLQESTSYFHHYRIISRSNFSGRKRLLKTENFWEKKARIPVKKTYLTNFPGVIEYDKTQGAIWNPPWGFLAFTLEVIRTIRRTSEVVEKKTFFWERKRQSFKWKKFCGLFFSRFIEHEKCQGTFYKGLRGFLTFIVQMIRSFLWDLRGR